MSKAKRHWLALMRLLSVEPSISRKHWRILSERYGEPGRHYHTMKHITHFIEALHRFTNPDAALLIAAFYHDAIYDSRSQENEIRSAELAQQFLNEIGADEMLANEVKKLILATHKHRLLAGADQNKQALFLDCDLLIIGESKKRYDTYASQIREEYRNYDDSTYRLGRKSVLSKFLERQTIYLTRAINEAHEAKARANIERELKALD